MKTNRYPISEYSTSEVEMKEIVQCKDCKYGIQCTPPDEDRYCVLYDQRHNGGWFCADGEVEQDGLQ